MTTTVHVVDASIAGDARRFDQLSTRHRGDVVIRLGAMCNGVAQALIDVTRSTIPRSIGALVFYGHGVPGAHGVSVGRDGSGMRHFGVITADVFDDAPVLAQAQLLRSRFATNGFVVLKGCNTADGVKGKQLLVKLARVFGVCVKASDWFQSVGRTELVGNIVTAYPNGTVEESTREGMRNLGGLSAADAALLVGFEFGDRLLRMAGTR